jgi:ribonuclease R
MLDKEKIFQVFREKIGRPISFRDIVAIMGLNHKEARALKRVLRGMVRSGELVLTRKGLYGPPEDMNLVSGYFERHRDNFGFVILEKPGERDIFIPAWATFGAMNNDRVLVRVENWRKREGRIIRILERAYTKIAGTFEISKSISSVKPKDKSIHFDLAISPKDRGSAQHGDTVLAEIISYPTERKAPAGRIVKVIRKPSDPKAEVDSIINEFSIPQKFPRSVQKETSLLDHTRAERIELTGMRRKNLRLLHTVTVDGERAKDFDDAVSIKITPHGYKLFVHIADVGYHVQWNSAIDREARERGTSIYFPDRVIPMLPRKLSEDLCSLKPNVDRLTFTVEMDFDREGNRVYSEFYPSIIHSNERMTYTSVRRILIDNDKNEREKYDYLLQDFEFMGELCGILRNRRLQRGSLDFDLPEPEVLLDMMGRPEAIVKAERNFAHMIIEEFMIAANEAVAEHLNSLGIPTLYRIHEEPDMNRFDELIQVIQSVCKNRQPIKPKDLRIILKNIKGKPEEEIINYLVLRSLKQARYSHINVGHYGLASNCYTHFTSPIRRYPDLIVHRILWEVLQKKHLSEKRTQELNTILPDIAFHSSRMERLADKAEREVLDAMRAWFMKDKLGYEFEAKIVNITPYGLKVRLKDFFVEGFLHVSYMTDDFYHFNEKALKLVGRNTKRSFTIGSPVRVRIDRIDMEEREIILDLC